MGAELWYHRSPWRPDPLHALQDLQARFLAENYDLSAHLQQHLEGAHQSVAYVEAEGDTYGLLEEYRRELALLENLASQPLPEQPQERIAWLRLIHAFSGQGIGNVLDVTGVSTRGGTHQAHRLEDKHLVQLVGSNRPTEAEAKAAVGAINERLGRGESYCFAIYAEEDRDRPVGWFFIGNTID